MRQLQVDSGMLSIGASVPLGVSAAILIGGTNDTTTAEQMGARWEVRDPDGEVVDSYYDWEMWPYTSPGAEHGFVGNQFAIDKTGNWTISVELLMNRDDPVVVDTYDGLLCVVTSVFAGRITRKELDYDAVRVPIPVD